MSIVVYFQIENVGIMWINNDLDAETPRNVAELLGVAPTSGPTWQAYNTVNILNFVQVNPFRKRNTNTNTNHDPGHHKYVHREAD
jgi:hypothetical protein